MQVILDARIMRNFKSRAWRKYPKEHLEALFGHVEGDTFFIHMFFHMPHRATVWSCDYSQDELDFLTEEAEKLGMSFLGMIHTHTGLKTCVHPSPTDHKQTLKEGSPIMGILYLRKSGGRKLATVEFYTPQPRIQIKYTYK